MDGDASFGYWLRLCRKAQLIVPLKRTTASETNSTTTRYGCGICRSLKTVIQ